MSELRAVLEGLHAKNKNIFSYNDIINIFVKLVNVSFDQVQVLVKFN